MKAIYGALGRVAQEEVATMGLRLNHRGRNHSIERITNRLFLGCGNHDADDIIFANGRYVIVSDASIHNQEELTEHLVGRGYVLDGPSEEEVILALYQLEGIEGIGKINGDFSFAIWDHKEQELILGRDFLGCCPLYYASLSEGLFAFSSEYKALLALPGVVSIPEIDMIQHLQYCKKLPVGRTLLKDIYAVPAGSVLIMDSNGVRVGEERMPKLSLNIEYCAEEEAIGKTQKALFEAIQCRVGTQDTIGIALGGGIDSIGLLCICRKLYPSAKIHTFTAGYGEDDSDLLNASRAAKAMNTIHHEILTPPDLLKESLPRLVWHLEDPCSRSESLQLYELGREASKFVRILYSAQGADALFAGMPKHKILRYMKKAPLLKRPLEEFYNLTQIGIKPQSLLGKTMDTLYFRGKVPEAPRVIGTEYIPDSIDFPTMTREFINTVLVSDFQTGACQGIQKFERSLAAWGVSHVSPFCDPRLIQTGYSIPDSLKIRKGVEKYALRKALHSIVPAHLLNVPKVPQRMNYNLDFSRILDEVSDEYLSREKIRERGFFGVSGIQRLKKRTPGQPYSAEAAMRIWTALLTEIWAIEFLDKMGAGG